MPPTEHVSDATAACVAEFIDRVLCAARATTADTLAGTDLTVSQLRMLFVLLRSETACPVHEVADGVGLSLAAAGRAADRLVASGLIDRREDGRDRRVKRLSLTAAGHDLLATHFRLCGADLRGLMTALPDDIRIRLHDAVRAAVDYLPPAPGGCTQAPGVTA